MKKIYCGLISGVSSTRRSNFLRKMRIVVLLLLISITQTFALETYAQTKRISLNFRDESIINILNKIEDQSEFYFMFDATIVDVSQRKSINCEDQPITTILDKLLVDTKISYQISDRQIVLTSVRDAKTEQKTITGKVTDKDKIPLPGVSVIIKGTMQGTVTNSDGEYSLTSVPDDAILQFSFVGMKSQDISVSGKSNISVVMEEETIGLEEVVAVGYGVQKKVSLTGAISAITDSEITTTKNENVQNMLTGKIAGVRVTQKSSEPGTFNNTFDIRGMGDPLIIIDGIPRDNMTRINPEDIESLSVLKDASAAIYGVRAANGVVLITTKKGKAGAMELEYSGNITFQSPTGSPKSVNAAEWMTLANEMSMHDADGGTLRYSDEEIAAYENGTKKGTDWYNAIIRDFAPQTQHTISAKGGTEKTQFYTSIGYMYQESFFKSNSNNYDRYNVRSNVTSQIAKNLKVDVQLSGIMDKSNKTYESTDWIFRSMERSSPIQPIYANDNPEYIQEGYVDGSNPLAMANSDISGYKIYDNKWFQSSLSLEYDVPFVDGLKAKAMFAYDYHVTDYKEYKKKYDLYNYDEASGTYDPTTHQNPSTIGRAYYSKQSLLHQVSLNYSKMFDEKHNVNALLVMEGQRRKADNFYAERELSIELDQLFAGNSDEQVGSMYTGSDDLYDEANLGLIGKFNYDFSSKYLAEFSFRYDGSSKFASGKQWGFFPSASIGWRISEEGFWDDFNLGFINNAKIRASYGKLGDDDASSYQYVSGYTYPASGDYNNLPGGYFFDGSYVNSSVSTGIANTDITWYTSKTFDMGIDLDAWDGKLGIIADYFRREREGLLTTRDASLPSVVGADLPEENLNGDLTKGFDLEISHHSHFRDINYQVKATFGFTRKQYTYQEVGTYGNSYEEWLGNTNDRYSNIVWGYSGDGQFGSYSDIANSSVYYDRSTLPGDYIYQDWNGDGIISDLDIHPIAYDGRPMINYGLTMAASWKGFDFNVLFQGAGKSYVAYTEILAEPNWGSDYSNSLAMFLDRWRPADSSSDPYDPNTEWVSGYYAYSGTNSKSNSTFRYNNTTYLRLKSAEIGYTLPSGLTDKIGIKDARVYLNGYNLYTWSSMDYIDPEHPSDSYGNVYPLSRTVSVGLNVKF